MNKVKLIGIDLAKRYYQVCAVGEHNKVLYNRKYTAKNPSCTNDTSHARSLC